MKKSELLNSLLSSLYAKSDKELIEELKENEIKYEISNEKKMRS